MNNDIKEIQSVIDQMQIQLANISVRQNILESMILGICKDLFPVDTYRNLFSNYVDSLNYQLNDSLTGMENILFDAHKLVHEKFSAFQYIQQLKLDPNYLKDE